MKNTASFPQWRGVPDVSVAFVLALQVFVIMGLAQGKVHKQAEEASYRAHRILTNGVLELIVVFFRGVV